MLKNLIEHQIRTDEIKAIPAVTANTVATALQEASAQSAFKDCSEKPNWNRDSACNQLFADHHEFD